jgi:hypothetical protein
MPRGPAVLTAPVDPAIATGLLSGWGFLVHPDLPDLAGDAYLLVALRPAPELDHFDPERLEVWVSDGSRGKRLEITRATRPFVTDYAWGTIRIVDRFGIANEFVSSGGHLAVDRTGEMTVAVLTSPAPILRRGGHSQGWDEAAVDLAAYFGRLMLAVDYVPGYEASLAASTPLARYAAFIADALDRHLASSALRAAHSALWPLVCAEERRLQRDHPEDWASGRSLQAAATPDGSQPAHTAAADDGRQIRRLARLETFETIPGIFRRRTRRPATDRPTAPPSQDRLR